MLYYKSSKFCMMVALGLVFQFLSTCVLANPVENGNHQEMEDESDYDHMPQPKGPSDNKVTVSGLAALTALMKDASDPKTKQLADYISQLIARRDARALYLLVRKLNDQMIYNQRMAKCIQSLGSKAVCSQNTSFYLWAQKLAKDIMNGQD